MDCDDLALLGNPGRTAFPHRDAEGIDRFGMRILGSAQDEFLAFQQGDETRVRTDTIVEEFNDLTERLVPRIRHGEPTADAVQELEVAVLVGTEPSTRRLGDAALHACWTHCNGLVWG